MKIDYKIENIYNENLNEEEKKELFNYKLLSIIYFIEKLRLDSKLCG